MQSSKSPQNVNVVKEVDIKKLIVKNLVMGGIAGIIGSLCTYPADLVKTTLQMQARSGGQILYKNTVDCFIKIVKNNGPKGLYRGIGAQLVGIAPEKAIKLTMNDSMRYYFTDKKTGDIPLWAEGLSGGCAGLSQVVVTNPYELVKVRLQTQTKGPERKTAITIIRELGFRGLFTGASACLLRDIPFSVIYFTLYGNLKRLQPKDANGKLHAGQLFVCAFGSGTVAATSVTPMDVIKTRLQAQSGGVKKYDGIIDCAKSILKNEGFPAFFKGTVPRILIISPLFAITLMTYEVLQGFFL